jgi:hypothetical protein
MVGALKAEGNRKTETGFLFSFSGNPSLPMTVNEMTMTMTSSMVTTYYSTVKTSQQNNKMMMQNNTNNIKPETKRIITGGILFAALYSIGIFELGREIGSVESSDYFHRQLRSLQDCGGHAKKLFGHVHMAKVRFYCVYLNYGVYQGYGT